ncbi:flavodoxin family protein [Bacteroides sp.]
MSKKVLIISASPRKGGNSDTLCDQFMQGAHEAGHQVEKIFLRNKKVNYCTGCGSCYNQSKPCPQKDDTAAIIEAMIAADVIVMATPVYFYTMDAQMKTLIDRTCARYTEISNKQFYFIATAADNDHEAMKRTFEGFRGFTDCLNGAEEKGVIYGTGAWQMGEIKSKPAMQEAYNMGKTV